MAAPQFPPPVYDIDDYRPELVTARRQSIHVVYDYWKQLWLPAVDNGQVFLLRQSHPDEVLLRPEWVTVVLCEFDASMGNGFDSLLENRGPEAIKRPLEAIQDLAAPEHQKVMGEAKKVIDRTWASLNMPRPDIWTAKYDEFSPEYQKFKETIRPLLAPLNSRYWNIHTDRKEDLYMKLLQYLQNHRQELLRRRNPKVQKGK